MRHGECAGGATVVAALVGLCALTGCSSSHGVADSVKPTTPSTAAVTTTSTVPSSTSTTSATSVVLSAYRAAWAAFEHAAADANPEDPGCRVVVAQKTPLSCSAC